MKSPYHYSIDFPQGKFISKKCEVSGWIFHKEGHLIKEIRLRIKNKNFNASIGRPRPDVASYFKHITGSYLSGFKGSVELHAGFNRVILEASSEENCWEPVDAITVISIHLLKNSYLFLIKVVEKIIPKKSLLFPFKVKLERIIIAFIQGDFLTIIHYYLDRRKLVGLGYLVQHQPKKITYESYPVLKKSSKKNLITIVTPSYNQGVFLEKTIQSVLTQNYEKLEYIIIDGGSEDASPQLIKKYSSYLAHWVREKDHGQSHAIQKGFHQSSGRGDDIMAYLNADDLYLPGCLDFVACYFEKNPNVDLIYGHRVLIDEHDNEIGRWFTPRHNNYNLSIIDYVPQETMFWRKRIYDKIGGIDPSFHFAMDWDLLLRMQESGAVIKRIPYFLGCFRVHPQQKTNTQMSTTGEIEINRLRNRSHLKAITQQLIAKVHKKNSIESALTHFLFSKGIRF